MNAIAQPESIDSVLKPLMVLVNQFKLDTLKYRRYSYNVDIPGDTEFELLAIRNNSDKVCIDTMVGTDPYCKITPTELHLSIQRSFVALKTLIDFGCEVYIGDLDFKLTATPRKVHIEYKYSDQKVLKLSYSRT